MPKKNRLTGAQIRRLKPGKRLISSLFSLSATVQESAVTQIACIVSKKVSAKAVVRNTVKRRMHAALAGTKLPTGMSLVLTAKKTASQCPYSEVHKDITMLIERLRSGK